MNRENFIENLKSARESRGLTQKQVSEALDRMNCTRIVNAHRLSTIKNCDRIFVMHKGRIVEEGTHKELIAMKGRYAELVRQQSLGEFGAEAMA